jgi:hypothetical protein
MAKKKLKVVPAIRERTPFVLIPWALADRTVALYQCDGETICAPLKDYLLSVAKLVGYIGDKTAYAPNAPSGVIATIRPASS